MAPTSPGPRSCRLKIGPFPETLSLTYPSSLSHLLLSYSVVAPSSLSLQRLFQEIVIHLFVYFFPGVRPGRPGAVSLWFTAESRQQKALGWHSANCGECEVNFAIVPSLGGAYGHLMRKKDEEKLHGVIL